MASLSIKIEFFVVSRTICKNGECESLPCDEEHDLPKSASEFCALFSAQLMFYCMMCMGIVCVYEPSGN